jgi:exosortase A-associated hydrolase 1
MSAVAFRESGLVFPCGGERLVGVLACPAEPAATGVLVIVGGPQYRAGSHRQFVHLSRHLAGHGIACMRFDYRGMGDSTGAMRTFESVDDDIRAAVDAFLAAVPSVRSVVLWGLCDGASAACFYAPTDPRVAGLILANPWVRTQETQARTYLKHYYLKRVIELSFWRKLLSGEVRVRDSAASLGAALAASRQQARTSEPPADLRTLPLPERMAHSVRVFGGGITVLLSGNDYTAAEFKEAMGTSKLWQDRLAQRDALIREFAHADHTFSRADWKRQVAEASVGVLAGYAVRSIG